MSTPGDYKRQIDADEADNIANLLDGDDFVTDEEQRAAGASRRRQERLKRLKQLGSRDDAIEETTKIAVDHAWAEKAHAGAVDAAVQIQVSIAKSESPFAAETEDVFDMFSSSVSPVVETSTKSSQGAGTAHRGHDQDDYDDAEGYYKAMIGETISVAHSVTGQETTNNGAGSMSFRVSGVIGKGVFSTVLKCSTVSSTSSVELPHTVAIKFIRHNDTMAKAAINEMQVLQRLKGSAGVVPLLLPTTASPMEHRGHVILVFDYMEYNLRDVLQKFGKGVGLSLQAVRSYFGQLLAAAAHLKKHGIIHADVKPDNILVKADFSVVQLADFGSAIDVNAPEGSQPTPYLVSRFYRAPEIILGLAPTYAIDLWSLAVTVGEIFLGDVLFKGASNNDMLFVFMQHLGPFSNRVIRQHLVQCNRYAIPRQFQQDGTNYLFTRQTTDPVTGDSVYRILSLLPQNNEQTFPSATPLKNKLLKAKSASDSRTMVLHFADLLQKSLSLDASRRIAIKDALQHPFFTQQQREDTKNI